MTPRAPLLLLLLAGPTAALADGGVQTKRETKADGTQAWSYTQPVDEIATVFGMDLSRASRGAAPVVGAAGAGEMTGAAYAKVSLRRLPDWLLWSTGTVNVAVNPADASGKVSATFMRSIPVAAGIEAVMADGYAFASGGGEWETGKTVSLKLVETGTTFSLAAKAAQDTQGFQPTLSAQQKLFGGLHLTTSVTDTGDALNRSVTAGFAHRW